MGTAQQKAARELAWTAAGASAGSLARLGVDPIWPQAGHAPLYPFVVATVAAVLVGFALAAPHRGSMTTFLSAAGGTAGSISVAAARAAWATPAQSAVGVAGFVAGAVAGVSLGMSVYRLVTNYQRRQGH